VTGFDRLTLGCGVQAGVDRWAPISSRSKQNCQR